MEGREGGGEERGGEGEGRGTEREREIGRNGWRWRRETDKFNVNTRAYFTAHVQYCLPSDSPLYLAQS